MSIMLKNHRDQMEQLATNHGYGNFARWVRSIGFGAGYDTLAELVEKGWTDDLQALTDDLMRALSEHAPADTDVAKAGLAVAKFATKSMDSHDGQGAICVTDGMVPDDGSDEEIIIMDDDEDEEDEEEAPAPPYLK